MKLKEPTFTDLLIDTHIGLERQGPGSIEATEKALGFIDGIDETSRIADLGCGTGGGTIEIARNIGCSITGLDIFPKFIRAFDENMFKCGLNDRVKGIVGDMGSLPFEEHSLDLIWSEGAIDNIGFEKGISHWRGFLKDGGYIAVTCPSWLTGERPDAVSRFWEDAGSHLDSVDENIRIMTKHGYRYIASFTLPDECWTKNYFIPRSRAIENLTGKYIENDFMKTFIEQNRYEEELFSRYSMHYGYVFYIAQKT